MKVRPLQTILDTNVIYSAARSRTGASYKLLSLIPNDRFEVNISTPLVLEYEDVLKRPDSKISLSEQQIDDILDYMCRVANQRKIHFQWRPLSPDPDDDFLLELAIACDCDYIVTYNIRDFYITSGFGIKVVTPKDFLRILEEMS